MREDGVYGNSEAVFNGAAGSCGADGGRTPGRAWFAVGNYLLNQKSPEKPGRFKARNWIRKHTDEGAI